MSTGAFREVADDDSGRALATTLRMMADVAERSGTPSISLIVIGRATEDGTSHSIALVADNDLSKQEQHEALDALQKFVCEQIALIHTKINETAS